jgi:molybdenum cofactor guanylyltransferase
MTAGARGECGDLTGAILAGGRGSRVDGRDKGLIVVGGEPLIARVCSRVRPQVAALLICANRNADRYAAFGPVVEDREPGFAGPLAGIASALAACATPWLLTVPVDCPEPPRDLGSRLLLGAGNAVAAAARIDGRREPLFAIYRRDLAPAAVAACRLDRPVWRWQDEIGATEVDFSDRANQMINLNSADDIRRWEQRRG